MRTLFVSLVISTAALAEEAPAAPAPAPGFDILNGRFEFGSYGRVGIGSDLAGQVGRTTNIVSHGPRLIEDGYAELELRREDTFGQVKSRVVSTVAFFPPFFHFDGQSAQSIGLRNLYAEASVGDGFSAWAGSRMYRGDDVYLLNFWPLDDLNTVGGGVRFGFGKTTLRFHVGMQRLDLPSTRQVVANNNPVGFGAISVTRLDRPRLVESLKLTHELDGPSGIGVRLSFYAEGHQLPSGVRRSVATGDEQTLPGDWGVLFGGQATVWHEKHFAHVWARQTVGLATTDELTMPTTFNNQLTTVGARSTRLALAGGWDSTHLGLQLGGYLDLVRDAAISDTSAGKYDEGAVSARLQWYAAKYFGVAVEASMQRRVYALVDESGALRGGSVTQLGVMPYFSPLGHGNFQRPQLRLVYALSLRDAGARSFYGVDDPFSRRGVEHFVGLSVEWWFNATTYPSR
ncbi:MAG: carbohydrate porin [Myxococcales bacterium]|nr:carbohydrate porin [Myxococcales bacterium]